MKQLSVIDALDIMQSDMKMWDSSEKVPVKGGLRLTLNLPWGIGETHVTLEGLGDAKARRHAVGAYGEYIRGLIKERIDDTAITARAKVAAGRREQDDSPDSPEVSDGPRVREPTVKTPASSEAGQARKKYATKPVGLGETLAARRAEVEDRIEWELQTIAVADNEIRELRRELRGIVAALEAMDDNAPEDSGEKEAGTDSPTTYYAGITEA